MLSLFKDIGYSIDNFPISYKNYCGEISLPIYPQLTIEQVDYVINSVISSVNKIVS